MENMCPQCLILPVKAERKFCSRSCAAAFINMHRPKKYPDEHGFKSRLYTTWKAMVFRCHYPSHEAYARYGGLGKFVCDEWRHDYMAFRSWALANGHDNSLQLDRINNDKGYSAENCRWVTTTQQQRNKGNNVYLTAFGETKTSSEWVKDTRCLISYPSLRKRIESGRPIEWAISAPPYASVRRNPLSIETKQKISNSHKSLDKDLRRNKTTGQYTSGKI